MIAGPLAATLLADFGAKVIKIEMPVAGDAIRHWAPMKEGKSLWWKVIGRNKTLATLKLSDPEGAALFKRLVAGADVVIENFRPGTFARWGLSYEALSAVNEKIVLAHVSGFGQDGPYSRKGGYGTVAEAFSGAPSFTGFSDKPPSLPGFPLADSVAATFTAMSVMFALYERDQRSGKGQEIDISLYEPLFRLIESQVIGFDQLGIVKGRIGNQLAEDAPRNTYLSKDGAWIALSASSQKTFQNLAQAIGLPQLATDPRYLTNATRCQNRTSLDEILTQWFGEHESSYIQHQFEEYAVVAGPILSIADIVRNCHYAFRNDIISVSDADFGTVRMQGVTPKFSRTPGGVRHSGKAVGADNVYVYRNLLGLSAEDVHSLSLRNII